VLGGQRHAQSLQAGVKAEELGEAPLSRVTDNLLS